MALLENVVQIADDLFVQRIDGIGDPFTMLEIWPAGLVPLAVMRPDRDLQGAFQIDSSQQLSSDAERSKFIRWR